MKNHNKLSNIITALVLVLVTLAVVLLSKFTGNSDYSESGQTFAPVNENIDIKIGESKLRRTGLYTGSFNQISGPQYTDGERMTLHQLSEKYPFLRIVPTIGVLLGEVVQNYDGSEEFGERNNGNKAN